MQLFGDKSDESSQQQQQHHQQQQDKQETKQTCDALQAKMHKFYPPKPKINAFNDLFRCYLCQGYMINPTTIDICMHTYCRSCIARHLAVDCYCPQCKTSSGGSKAITISNLKSDDILRSIIFKLVPGLYQKERERLVQFVKNTKNEGNLIASSNEEELVEPDEDFFSPSDPISLSLEFHPVLAEQCPKDSVPPIRYLQCPASVKVQHLKRFLCSKFNIDLCNKKVGIDIIYEDEILPSDFTLMDVGYCYQWERHAPLRLTYRILIFNEDMPVNNNHDNAEKKLDSDITKTQDSTQTVSTVTLNGDEKPLAAHTTSLPQEQKSKSLSKSPSSASRHSLSLHSEVPVKVTISRKTSENKKSVSKKSSFAADEFVVPTTTTNDFKSLRSNDIRFSNYTITSTSTPNTPSVSHVKREKFSIKEEKPTKCNIVVSIPHNQMQEEWDSKPLSELKTASKKSPNSASMEVTKVTPTTQPAKKNRNVPKLKIELNSLKTKLIEKPKSADIRLDTLMLKHHRPRKFSLDEPQPVVDKVDLETYVKNIGLKPIEVQANTSPETPNASPMSSSSSTTSSSTGNFNFNGSSDITSSSSSSHKKRKKKHSKDCRESKDSKRKKLHAEISSHSAEESLKMKVKLTSSINLKSLKLDSKKSPKRKEKSAEFLEIDKSKSTVSKVDRKDFDQARLQLYDKPKDKSKSHSIEIKKSKSLDGEYSHQETKKLKDLEGKSSFFENKMALSNSSGNSIAKEFDDEEDLSIPDSTSSSLNKPLVSIKETSLPQSPPLPPSLFKTTTLTFPSFPPNITSVAKAKPAVTPKDAKDKPKPSQMKPIAPKPMAPKLLQPSTFKNPQFAVPSTPSRFISSTTTKFLSTPTSIASAANKHFGNLLKRSISLDEHKNSASPNKQPRLEKPSQITISAYGSNLHMTKVDIPATPTSSTAKATYEIPLYSPLSASYNPKCSFSVNSTTISTGGPGKSAKGSMSNTTLSNLATTAALKTSKHMEIKKTTNTDATSTSHMANCKISSSPATTTLMGPPKPMQKFNSNSNSVPIPMKSPPPLTSGGQPFTSNSLSVKTSSSSPSSSVKTTTQHKPAVLNTASLSMVNYKQSKVLLAHVKPTNLSDIKLETKTTATSAAAVSPTAKSIVATTNSLSMEKSKTSSLREFRLPSRESAPDILDLSPSTKTSTNAVKEKVNIKTPATTNTTPTATSITTPTTNSSSSSSNSHLNANSSASSTSSTLEMALNKIKQNMSTITTNTPNTTTLNHIPSIVKSAPLDNGVKKTELATSSSTPISDDLQNLHLLSESATAREKIAIGSGVTISTASSMSPYEKVKITQNTLVRQQNASVRNIPNPSALAFRNQQPTVSTMPPMVTIAAGIANKLNDLDKPLLLKTSSPPKSPYSLNCSATTSSSSTSSSTSPSRSTNKKHHPSIDQVAASLNMRASAAAEASAKANSKPNDETALVTSTSSLDGKQIKLEAGEYVKSNDATSAVLPSSTTTTTALNTSRTLINNLEIKKEPDEKDDDSCEITEVDFASSATATATTTTTNVNKTSMIENLVTSVINVTTPTTKLFTAASSVGY